MDFLGKAFSWVKSKAEGTFDYLKVKINKSLSSARRFFDNFSEKLKQHLIETKNFIDKAMRKILEPLSSMVRLVRSFTFEKVKEKLALLITRLIEEMKRLASYFKNYKSSTKEAEGETRQRYKSPLDSEDEEKLDSFENLVFGFGKFLGIILRDGLRSKLLGMIFNSAYSLCAMDEELKKVDEGFKEMKLGEDERQAAMFAYVIIKNVKPVMPDLLGLFFKSFFSQRETGRAGSNSVFDSQFSSTHLSA